jgi:hypothetical protein
MMLRYMIEGAHTPFNLVEGAPVPCSLWSRGRNLGQTDLSFLCRPPGIRFGWFHPNALGERLMPAATGVGPAIRESRAKGNDVLVDPEVLSACDHERALELELRGPNGAVIATESIAIIDTHYLLSIARYDEEGDESQSEWEPDEAWREAEEFPRYQVQAYLVDHHAIP